MANSSDVQPLDSQRELTLYVSAGICATALAVSLALPGLTNGAAGAYVDRLWSWATPGGRSLLFIALAGVIGCSVRSVVLVSHTVQLLPDEWWNHPAVRLLTSAIGAATAWATVLGLFAQDLGVLTAPSVRGGFSMGLLVGFASPEWIDKLRDISERLFTIRPTVSPSSDAPRGRAPSAPTASTQAERTTLPLERPRDAAAARRLIEQLRGQGRTEEAAELFDLLIELDPADDDLISEKAQLYLQANDLQRYVDTLAVVNKIRSERSFKANLGQTITVAEVEVTDLSFFGDFTWPLQPGVNVLLGKNGFGKSYLLRGIVAMLQEDKEATSQFFPAPTPRAVLRTTRPTFRVDIAREGKRERAVRSRTVFDRHFGKVPVLAIPDMRYIEKADDSLAPLATVTDLRSQGAEHFINERSFQSVILTFLYELCRDYDGSGKFEQPLFRLIERTVQRLTDSSFKFYEIGALDNARYRILVLTDGNAANPLPLQRASQGTLSVLSMVGLVYRFLKALHPDVRERDIPAQQAIVVIDEIDAHLHPAWQQQILQLFRDTFPNVQFIVTAHTPLVVAGCRRREVSVLRKSASGFTVEVLDEHFIGASAAALYQRVFEVEDKDPAFLQLNTLLGKKGGLEARIDDLQQRDSLKPDEAHELEQLEEQVYYLNEAAHVSDERAREAAATLDRQRLELDNKNLEGRVSELESRLSARSPQPSATTPNGSTQS